jgi:antitoxin CptB
MATVNDADFGRLRWACRRGIRELDVLLTRYVDEKFRAAPAEEQEAFRRLLEAQNPVIYAYCLGQQEPPSPEMRALLLRIVGEAAGDR